MFLETGSARRFGSARVNQIQLTMKEIPEYKTQPFTRDLVRVDLGLDQDSGGGIVSSFLRPDSGAPHPCLVSEIYEGSLADQLCLTPGCALVLIWEDDQPWIVADLTQDNVRFLTGSRPISLIFIATEECREKRAQASNRWETDVDRDRFFLSTPTTLDYAIMDTRCWGDLIGTTSQPGIQTRRASWTPSALTFWV